MCKSLLWLVVVALGLVVASAAYAQGKRQYYSRNWQRNNAGKYYYKTYYYRSRSSDGGYKQQVVVYKPQRNRNYVYWYNPETKKYWARCPTVNHPQMGAQVAMNKDFWSMLPNAQKKDNLDNIDENAFGPVQEMSPPIPGSDDGATIECPPPGGLPPG